MSDPSERPVDTLKPPYYAVIFTSERTGVEDGYDDAARRMVELASEQPGFLGVESTRGAGGLGITVSYWESEEDVARWRADLEHRAVQRRGRDEWYRRFRVRVARVEREYGFEKESHGPHRGSSPPPEATR